MESNFRAKLQAFGGFLTAMVIPNMGAFIAWGFITALFIPTGWTPNESFAKLVGPMISYLLPLLLAYTGGKLIAGDRGGVAGAIGTIGLVIGSEIPMFLGAMIMGPLSAYIVKCFDQMIDGKIPPGFEMLINNFSLGIIGLILCLTSYSFVGPVIQEANAIVSSLIQALVQTGFLPLLSLINEPAKVLFLNNVIDQGIYYPLGMQDALNTGKSIYFMVASNPGAGLGLLLAYSLFGMGDSKKSAPGAIIIHFLGGIHEIYFPYVLMKPITILAMIGGSACGILTFSLFDTGLVAGPSPGSIFAYLALTPKGNFIAVISGVLVATVVSFLITSFILKASGQTATLKESMEKSRNMKAEGKSILNSSLQQSAPEVQEKQTSLPIRHVAFACDAGLGSSAMGASAFKKKLAKIGITDIEVKNYAIEKVPEHIDVVVTHLNLADRAKLTLPDKRIITIENFLADPNLAALLEEIQNQK